MCERPDLVLGVAQCVRSFSHMPPSSANFGEHDQSMSVLHTRVRCARQTLTLFRCGLGVRHPRAC